MRSDLAKIPPIHELISLLQNDHPDIDQVYLKTLAEEAVAAVRSDPASFNLNRLDRPGITKKICTNIDKALKKLVSPSFRRLINGTGVILHTGLGRAPLGQRAFNLLPALQGYTNLEISIESGKRGERLEHLIPLLQLLTGTEDAVIVNNNAAAVLLILNALARRKEVIISRGELVEIGGSFRMAEVMKSSGAKMVEVGSTNKTHLSDYASAISERTAAIMLVHPSNFEIVGFTGKPGHAEIIELAHHHNIPVIYDLGSGALIDMRNYGLAYEPVVREVLRLGYDMVCFSGDKLLGGPQAGIILGKKIHLAKIKKNHLLRALRCDKITLALLSQTLQQYLSTNTLEVTNPTLNLLSRKEKQLRLLCDQVLDHLEDKHRTKIKVIKSSGKVGSGAYPVSPVPSVAIRIRSEKLTANQLAIKLRRQTIPVFGYIVDDVYHIDFLAVMEDDVDLISQSLNRIL